MTRTDSVAIRFSDGRDRTLPPCLAPSISVRTMVRFTAGGSEDPKPAENEFAKRHGRCLTCKTKIVHFSKILKKWVYVDGTFHTGHTIEVPTEWLRVPA